METKDTLFEQFQQKAKPKVPEGYFEGFSTQMLHQIKAEETPKPRLIYRRISYWAGAAAILTGIYLGINILKSDDTVKMSDLSKQELVAYLDDHLDDLDAAELLHEVAEKQQEPSKAQTSESDEAKLQEPETAKKDSALSKEEILHYLNSHELDLEDIEEIY